MSKYEQLSVGELHVSQSLKGAGILDYMGLPFTTGNRWWVDGGVGIDGYGANGKTKAQPFDTVDYAVGRCTANNGDQIIVMPGHTETISAAGSVTVDVAGIDIICLGVGADRPTFNFTATTSTFLLSAASCRVMNALFTGGIDAVVTMFTISAADNALIKCETKDVTGQMTSCITTTAAANRLLIDQHVHRGAAAAGGANWAEIVGGDGITISDPWVDGNFDVAVIQNVTTATTNFSLYGGITRPGYLRTRNAADVIATMVATSTGNIGPNLFTRVQDNAANITEAFVGADMQFFDPIFICNLDGERGMNSNITASTDG